MEHKIKIFDLIKKKKFIELKKYIKINDKKNYDIQDDNFNYFIHYIILYNKNILLKYIFETINLRLDILDIDGRNLLYIPIKFNYFEILKLLLKYDKKNIGISIIDIKDRLGLTGLHYSCIFNNIKSFKLLLENNSDPLIENKNGINTYHMALQYKRTNILLYLLDNTNDYTFLSKQGESIFQLALNYENNIIIDYLINNNIDININNTDLDFNLTALHQVVILGKNNLAQKIIKIGADINKSDNLGNTPLHYCFIENNLEFAKILITYNNLIYNLTNINGETPLHIFINNEHINNYPNLLEKIIQNTNLNIQNNQGETCFYLLVKNKLWNQSNILTILENKELNLFIQTTMGETIFSLNNKENIIDLVSKSYLKQIKKNYKNLILDWEKYCSNNEYNKLIKILKIKGKTSTQLCLKKIKHTIQNNFRSIPKYKETNFILDNGIFVDVCYYTGSSIDILFGLIWLKNEFPNINLILDYPLTINENLEKYYEKLGLSYDFKLNFSNIEIVWSYQQLFYPTFFDSLVDKIIKNNKTYIIIPLGIETSQGSHANILFWDIKNKIIERFEPNGNKYPRGYNYNPELLDSLLTHKFNSFDKDILYISPHQYLPNIGFQLLETLENTKCKRIGDPNGFCAIWCIWWCYQKLSNLKISSDKLANILIKTIKFKNKSFKNLIRNFSQNIVDLRDSYLKKYNLDINDWLTNNYSEKIINKLEQDIINIIN